MNYLEYIKDFDDLAKENERIHELKKLYDSPIADFTDYYFYDDEFSSVNEDLENKDIEVYDLLGSEYLRLNSDYDLNTYSIRNGLPPTYVKEDSIQNYQNKNQTEIFV